MERTAVQKLARVLKLLVGIVWALNMICLFLVPGFVALQREFQFFLEGGTWNYLTGEFGLRFLMHLCLNAVDLAAMDGWLGSFCLLCLFFWICGACTALILWQAREVLNTILEGEPFQMRNADALRRAAVCCWVISGTALARLILWLGVERNPAPLFTYNTLFVFAFLMAGLLFQVMSALFRQAAELKEDQDLTI